MNLEWIEWWVEFFLYRICLVIIWKYLWVTHLLCSCSCILLWRLSLVMSHGFGSPVSSIWIKFELILGIVHPYWVYRRLCIVFIVPDINLTYTATKIWDIKKCSFNKIPIPGSWAAPLKFWCSMPRPRM